MEQIKICNTCSEPKDILEFGRRWDSGKPNGMCNSCFSKYHKAYRKKNPEKLLLVGARFRSKKKGWFCNLTIEDVKIPEYCPVLGIKLIPGQSGPRKGRSSRGSDTLAYSTMADCAPTLDRIDQNLGYVKGNVAVISWRANRIKNDGTMEDHEKIVEYMCRHKLETQESAPCLSILNTDSSSVISSTPPVFPE